MIEQQAEYLTVSRAAAQIGISARALRRVLEAPENAARTQRVKRATANAKATGKANSKATGKIAAKRETIVIDPDWVAEWATKHGIKAVETSAKTSANGSANTDGNNVNSNVSNNGATMAEGDATHQGDASHQGDATHQEAALVLIEPLRRDVEQIKAFIAGDMAARLQEALSSIPTRDDITEMVSIVTARAIPPLLERIDVLTAQSARQERIKQERANAAASQIVSEAMTEAVNQAVRQALHPYIEQMNTLARQNSELRRQLEATRCPWWQKWWQKWQQKWIGS